MRLDVQHCVLEDKSVCMITIPKGQDRPYQTQDGKYWLRVGSTNRMATKAFHGRIISQPLPFASHFLQKHFLMVATEAMNRVSFPFHFPYKIDDTFTVWPSVDIVAQKVKFISSGKSNLVEQCNKSLATSVDIRNGIFSIHGCPGRNRTCIPGVKVQYIHPYTTGQKRRSQRDSYLRKSALRKLIWITQLRLRIVGTNGIEPLLPALHTGALTFWATFPSSGGNGTRTRNLPIDNRVRYHCAIPPYLNQTCNPFRIRTETGRLLKPVPLPIGLRGYLCFRRIRQVLTKKEGKSTFQNAFQFKAGHPDQQTNCWLGKSPERAEGLHFGIACWNTWLSVF